MNKANARRALLAAIDCIDCNDTESAREYALVAFASLLGSWGGRIGFKAG